MKGKMEHCKTCRYYDKKRSTGNWVVCTKTEASLSVIESGTSENCEHYEEVYLPRDRWVDEIEPKPAIEPMSEDAKIKLEIDRIYE